MSKTITGTRPLAAQPHPGRVRPEYDRADQQAVVDRLHSRLVELESRTLNASLTGELSGTVAASIDSTDVDVTDLSGSVQSLSGTLDAMWLDAGLDVRRGARWFDDYIGSQGSLYASSAAPLRDIAGHPGIINLIVAASASTSYTYAKDTSSGLGSFILGGGPIRFEALVKIPVLSNGTNNSALRVGLMEVAAWPLNGAFFENDRTRYGSSVWRFVTVAGGTRAAISLANTPIADTWQRLSFEIAAGGDGLTVAIDGTDSGLNFTSLLSTLPTAAGTVWQPATLAVKTLGAGSMGHHIDYTDVRLKFTTAR